MDDIGEGEQNAQLNDIDDVPQEQEPETPNANLGILQYLDKTIMPDLVKALDVLSQERPDDPIEFLGNYMLKQCEK